MPGGKASSTAAPICAAAAAVVLAAAAGSEGRDREAVAYEQGKTRVKPKRPLFDGPRPIRLGFGFKASRRVDLRIAVVHVRSGRTVAAWSRRDASPRRRHRQRWDGLNRRGRAARDGAYAFRLGPVGGPDRPAGRFRLRGHLHPVDGQHRPRGALGEFGAPRTGGRVHEGYDILAACGTPLVAARGGRVVDAGYDPRLYGNFIRINARKSPEQYFYSHLIAPARLDRGDRVRTGEVVGDVGRTGNAGSTPCHLHFELRRRGDLVDPEPQLDRWGS